MTLYTPLSTCALVTRTCFRRPASASLRRVTMDSPAMEVMTDFRQVAAVTISPGASIDDANQKMIENGIRLLLVVEYPGTVLGIITAGDILGEKPMQLVQERGVKHTEITVRDIMTQREMLEVAQMRDVLKARVGHVLATLRRAQRQHLMVVEPDGQDACQVVRGLFSASQIARQLGVPVHIGDIARTFAEIEASLNHEHRTAHASPF